MNITIHRGTDRIGGCVTEYEDKGWRLFVDFGEQLPESADALEIESLTHGDLSKSALFITHYHGDHLGKIAELPDDLPVFMGELSAEIALASARHRASVDGKQRALAERLLSAKRFKAGEEVVFGPFSIMPLTIDHSAFDAYAFSIESRGLKVFHTGDFRTHGFRSKALPKVIETYVKRARYVVCEATNVERGTSMPEYELQKEFITKFKESRYNVVYASSTNIDRLFGLYHAAQKAGRVFIVSPHQKHIMDIVTKRDHVWGKSQMYRYKAGYEPMVLKYDGDDFMANEKFRNLLSERGYVLIASTNNRFRRLLAEIPAEGRKTYLSMWRGYVNPGHAAYNPRLAEALGEDFEYMHTSGHCDMQSLFDFFDRLRPWAIIPIHTENPRAFACRFCDRWPVLLLNDGETFSPIYDPGHDIITANCLAVQRLNEEVEILKGDATCYSLDRRMLGEFIRKKDAEFALRHVVYAPERILGYSLEVVEDMAPWDFTVYTQDLKILSRFSWGGHNPGGDRYQEPCAFNVGENVLAVMGPTADCVVPCEVVGPVTEEIMRRDYEKMEYGEYDTYEEYAEELWDWFWDGTIVRPLVKFEYLGDTTEDTELVQRVNLFPYREYSEK